MTWINRRKSCRALVGLPLRSSHESRPCSPCGERARGLHEQASGRSRRIVRPPGRRTVCVLPAVWSRRPRRRVRCGSGVEAHRHRWKVFTRRRTVRPRRSSCSKGCKPGLRCANGVCEPTPRIDEFSCPSGDDCAWNSVCTFTSEGAVPTREHRRGPVRSLFEGARARPRTRQACACASAMSTTAAPLSTPAATALRSSRVSAGAAPGETAKAAPARVSTASPASKVGAFRSADSRAPRATPSPPRHCATQVSVVGRAATRGSRPVCPRRSWSLRLNRPVPDALKNDVRVQLGA